MLASPVAVVIEGFIGYRLATILGSTVSAVAVLISSFLSSYIGVVTVYGFIYGLFSNLALHAPMCVMFLYFKNTMPVSFTQGQILKLHYKSMQPVRNPVTLAYFLQPVKIVKKND